MREKFIVFFIAFMCVLGTMSPLYANTTKWVSSYSTSQKEASTYDVDEEGAGVALEGTIHVNGIEKDSDAQSYSWKASNSNVTLANTTNQNVDVKGVSVGDVTLTQTIYTKAASSQVANANYNVQTQSLALSLTSATIQVNETLALQANQSVSYTSSDETIAKVDASGNITGMQIGQATITATSNSGETASCIITVGGSIVEEHTMALCVTNPQLEDVLYGIQFYEANYGTLKVTGASSAGAERIIYGCTNANVTLDEEGNFKVKKNLTATIDAFVDGKLLSAKMTITHVIPASLRSTILKKGMSTSINPSRFSHMTPVNVDATSNDALSVDNNVVTAHDYGKLTTTITGDNNSFTRDYWCVNNTTYNIIKEAFKIYDQKRHYSQPKRTASRYVDCSSYVWRVYRQAGFTLGSKFYPPTAAAEAKWLSSKKRLYAPTSSAISSLAPGDLLFYSSKKNGRYKNITHVEMYISSGASLGASGPYYGDEGGCVAQGTAVNTQLVAIGRVYKPESDVAPKSTKIIKLSAKKNKVKVSWSKTKGTGVSIQVSRSKSFKKGTKTIAVKRSRTSSSVKYTTKKKVYVRVRAYKSSVGKTHYSSWSRVKSD